MHRVFPIIAALWLVGTAAWLRFSDMNRRPVHTDEAVHAVKTGLLLDTGRYAYNPAEYHGPLLYYPSWLALTVAGKSFTEIPTIAWLRFGPALAGLLLVMAPLLALRLWGWPVVLCQMALTAFSTACVFFSPYYIQETPLVLFTFCALLAGRWLLVSPSWRAAAALGLSTGCMFACKETALLALAAMSTAALCLLWRRQNLRHTLVAAAPFALVAAALALFVAATALTHFWTRPQSFIDFFRAYVHYLGRALALDSAGGGAVWHHQPFFTYARLFFAFHVPNGPFWTEGGILLCTLPLLWLHPKKPEGKPLFVPSLALYTALLFMIYSAIPYKTPWTGLSFLHGCIVLGGLGTGRLWQKTSRAWQKTLLLTGIGLICAQLAIQTRRASTTYCADPRNPYVYAHTSPDMQNLSSRLQGLAHVSPEGYSLPIAVVAEEGDYWPLPWHLRAFTHAGYWESLGHFLKETGPLPTYAVVLGKAGELQRLEETLTPDFLSEIYGLRPHVLLQCHIRRNLWAAYMEQRQ